MKIKIGDITKIRTGKLDANAADENGQYPFFTCSKEPLKINTYSYDCECVLVAGNGDLNVKYYNGKFDAYQRTYIIEDDSDGLLFMPYLYFFMESYIDELRKQSIGGVIKYIKLKNLTDALIELPSIEVQRKIVNIISKSKEIVRRKENEFELLDELVRARFVEMFGDPIENTYSFPILKLGELSELITKGASPSWQGYSYTEDSTQTLFVTSENVREGYMDFSSIKYVEDAFNEKQKRSMIQKGDYLINIVGASIGRAAQFNMDCKANMNQAAALVRIKDNTISDNYLLYYLNSDKAQMMYNSMKSDTGRANLSLQDIANLEILVPDLTLQVKFASFVEEIDKSRLLNNHSLLLLKSITF
ncbi:restriction endonuclease subunit S [Catenibacterium sp. GCM10023432]|uniref:restriction endonuclease subunit S n=1 Tax=Catenibacterium sp. GCM10023432 TaxID=3252638 RepID=UPI003606277D